MKILSIGVFVLAFVAIVGCGERVTESPQATGPATRTPSATPEVTVVKKPIVGEADNTFSLSVPFQSVALTQGEEKAVLIGINRGANFGEEVLIEVSGLPAGVTVEATKPVIAPGSTGVTLVLKAAGDASLGDFTAKVTGRTASSGADFVKEFEMKVAEK